jgi:hypothetical protein
MTAGAGGTTMAGMNTELQLRVGWAREEPVGTVALGERHRPFRGWLELAEAIRTLTTAEAPSDARGPG